jgi:hypothetical protein
MSIYYTSTVIPALIVGVEMEKYVALFLYYVSMKYF